MGPSVSSRALEACRMSNEVPADKEVAATVRAAVAGGFQPEQVNDFPMKPEKGCLDLVSAWSHLYWISIVGLFCSSPRLSCADSLTFTRGRSTSSPRSLW